jgi:hypothetical protein
MVATPEGEDLMEKERPRSEPDDSMFRDPITGVTPVGPVQSAPDDTEPLPPEEQEERWGMMVKWFLMALLILALAAALGWYYL